MVYIAIFLKRHYSYVCSDIYCYICGPLLYLWSSITFVVSINVADYLYDRVRWLTRKQQITANQKAFEYASWTQTDII